MSVKLNPFEPPAPGEVVSSTLETHEMPPCQVGLELSYDEFTRLHWYASVTNCSVQSLLREIVEDFVAGLPELPNNS